MSEGNSVHPESPQGQQEPCYQDVFHRAPDGIVISDAEGNILAMNRTASMLLNSRPEALAGSSMTALVFPDDRRAFRGLLLRLREGAEPVEEELRLQPQGLSAFWASFLVGVERQPDGHVSRFLWHIRDITRRREEQDAALDHAQYDGVAGIVRGLSHEARNALQVSLSGLEMLALEMREHPESLDLIAHVKKSQEYIQYLFEKVREFSAPIPLDYRTTSLSEVIEEAWCHLAALRAGRDAEIQGIQGGAEVRCKVDHSAMEKGLRYLLGHFLEVGSGPAQVLVSWSKGDLEGHPAVLIALQVRGLDLSREEQEKFFEPFRRSRTGKACFGPAISRRIIEAHGGTVSLVDGAAAGITILVTIPLVPVRGARPKPFARKVDGLPERIQSIREEDIDSRHRLRPGEAG